MSATIKTTGSLTQALRGKDKVVLFATKAALKRGVWKKVFPDSTHSLLGTMIKNFGW